MQKILWKQGELWSTNQHKNITAATKMITLTAHFTFKILNFAILVF